jgi:hypothetical protein
MLEKNELQRRINKVIGKLDNNGLWDDPDVSQALDMLFDLRADVMIDTPVTDVDETGEELDLSELDSFFNEIGEKRGKTDAETSH